MALTDVVDADYLKGTYLFGIRDVDDFGNPFPALLYTSQIEKAALEVETETGLSLELVTVEDERHDIVTNDTRARFMKALRKRPVRDVTRAAVMAGTQPVFEYPASWRQIRVAEAGLVQIVPSLEDITVFQVAGGTQYMLGVAPGGYRPAGLRFDYTAGYDGVTYPYPADVKDAVALLASALFLDTAGDLILGAGIAGMSVSQDGQSTSINSTASATNSGYGARAGEYRRRAATLMARIRGRYRGIDVGAV